ncbi:MAG: response regulator [Rhodocyclaceae bacterium]|nr:response regulator [Rhodocyclaceae bacterium]
MKNSIDDADKRRPLLKVRTTALLAALAWSLVVFISLWTQRGQLDSTAAALARIDALANLKKDMAIRKWAASVGGVFINEDRVPNLGTLQEQERLSGTKANGAPFKLITLTPMHILQGIQAISNKDYGVKERLTSQQLHNRDNAPDDWELKALKSLESGAPMASETVHGRNGHGLMRLMIPMRMDKECLECHRDTLVPVGGLRGGAAISIDLNTYRSAQEPTWLAIQYWHLGIWILGLTAIYVFSFYARRRAMEHARQEEQRRENEMAFSAMAEGAIITDANGIILWVNDAFCRIFGYERAEVIGKNPRIVKSGRHGVDEYREFWRQLTSAGHWRGELWNRRKTGEVFPEEISIQALRGPDGKILRYISIFSDITERKRNDEELRKHREHLEDLVRQRTEELTVARDQADAANRSKSAFLANMSHELRTPLNAVIGFSQLMDKDPSLSATQRRNLEIINSSGNHLLTLINDVLELSKIESGKMQLEVDEVGLAELLHQVVDMMRVRSEQAGLSLQLDAPDLPAVVVLDAVKLRQVLLNLLSNAVKFTLDGGIAVKVGAQAAGAGTVRLAFAVDDTGIGIAPEDMQRIFRPFEQAGTISQLRGTGLGLTISRQYVQMMGGELSVQSTLGAGSSFRFSITVPLGCAPAAKRCHGRVTGLQPAQQGRRILIVDDLAETRLLLRALLEPLGFVLAEAADGAQAVAAVAAFRPQLILMDWRMPRVDGLEATQRIRARGDITQPRIVMLTANALDESRQQALATGADDFLRKPYEEAELYAMLEKHLQVRFEYEAERGRAAAAAPEALRADDLAGLAAAQRENLVAAVRSLNHERIEAALVDIEQQHPALAARLRELSEAMHYRPLWHALGIAGLE